MSVNGSIKEDFLGNTKTKKSIEKRETASKMWCFTLNNYSQSELDSLITFLKNGSKFIIGKEIGENKTPHLQGYVNFDKKVRMSENKIINKRIHWEKCKGTEKDNINYCSKDGDYILWKLKVIKPLKVITKLYPWQEKIEKLTLTEPDGRTINWFYDSIGNKGKSAFCKYMYINHNSLIIRGGKYSDIMNIIFNTDMDQVDTVIIDIPRCNKNNVSYNSIECILDGMITNTKFETGVKVFNPPHVIVFSNYEPELNEGNNLSEDRWKIHEIK